MMLTTRGRYAVAAILDVATNSTSAPVNLLRIAERECIDLRYLEQIFSKLRKAKIVNSVKGPGGGYLLARSVNELKISNIIDAVEENIKFTRCSGIVGCNKSKTKCKTHDLWAGLDFTVRRYLDQISIADLMLKR